MNIKTYNESKRIFKALDTISDEVCIIKNHLNNDSDIHISDSMISEIDNIAIHLNAYRINYFKTNNVSLSTEERLMSSALTAYYHMMESTRDKRVNEIKTALNNNTVS